MCTPNYKNAYTALTAGLVALLRKVQYSVYALQTKVSLNKEFLNNNANPSELTHTLNANLSNASSCLKGNLSNGWTGS